jgi:hypothetical protein
MEPLNLLPQQTLKKLDLSSRYAYYVGLVSIAVSIVVGLRTFFALWINTDTNFFIALVISLIVFYVFTQIYSFIILLGLRFLEKREQQL